MVQPISKPFMVHLHLLIERLRAAVDVRAAWTRLNVQYLIHVVWAGGQNYLRLHLPNILRGLHSHRAENVLLPVVVSLLRSLIDRDERAPYYTRNIYVLVVC